MDLDIPVAERAAGSRTTGTPRVPNRFHFVGDPGRRSRAFPLAHYLGLESCLEVNRPEAVYYYFRREPTGYCWDRIKGRIIPIELCPAPPSSFVDELCPGVKPGDFWRRVESSGFRGELEPDVAHMGLFRAVRMT